MTFSKHIIIVLWIAGILVSSCSQKHENISSGQPVISALSENLVFIPDTNDAALTLERVRIWQPESLADSMYRDFISGLVQKQMFKAALGHLVAYSGYFNRTPSQKIFARMKSGEAYNALAKYDSAIDAFSEALKINLEIQDSAAVAECEHNIGYNLQFKADFVSSLEHIYNALKYYESKDDSQNIFIAFYDIAEVYYQQNDFQKTFDFYKKCFDYYSSKQDTFQMAQMSSALADVHNKLGKYDEALEYSLQSILLWKTLGDIEGLANCYNTLASVFMSRKNPEEAIRYYKEAYSLVSNTEFQRPIPVLMLNLGTAYLEAGNLNESEIHLFRAIDELGKAGLNLQLQAAFQKMGELYRKKNKLDLALAYSDKSDSLEDINSAKKSAEAIANLNLKYATARKENEIMILNKEKQYIFTTARMFFLISIITLLLIVLVFIRNRHRRKQLETAKALNELELSKAKLKHDYDKKLMEDFAQRILDKNKLISELERKIKSAPGFNSSTENARQSLEELSKLKILTSDDWDKFQMNYNKVYPGSIKKILSSFSDLTEAELRMFLLIKLDIKIREVAQVLGISQESVRKTRYRMRKKLNIDDEADLDEFVKNFDNEDAERNLLKAG